MHQEGGKTTLNGAVTLTWGFTQEAPNEILILANDLEQSLARVFRTMEGIIHLNPELERRGRGTDQDNLSRQRDHHRNLRRLFRRRGSNHGLVSYDELWGYTSESSIGYRLKIATPQTPAVHRSQHS